MSLYESSARDRIKKRAKSVVDKEFIKNTKTDMAADLIRLSGTSKASLVRELEELFKYAIAPDVVMRDKVNTLVGFLEEEVGIVILPRSEGQVSLNFHISDADLKVIGSNLYTVLGLVDEKPELFKDPEQVIGYLLSLFDDLGFVIAYVDEEGSYHDYETGQVLEESSAKDRIKKKVKGRIHLEDILLYPPKEVLRTLTKNGYGRNLEYIEIAKRTREGEEDLGHVVLNVGESNVEGDVVFIIVTKHHFVTVPITVDATEYTVSGEGISRDVSRVAPDLPQKHVKIYGYYMADIINEMLEYHHGYLLESI
jgi:hypothetical protein